MKKGEEACGQRDSAADPSSARGARGGGKSWSTHRLGKTHERDFDVHMHIKQVDSTAARAIGLVGQYTYHSGVLHIYQRLFRDTRRFKLAGRASQVEHPELAMPRLCGDSLATIAVAAALFSPAACATSAAGQDVSEPSSAGSAEYSGATPSAGGPGGGIVAGNGGMGQGGARAAAPGGAVALSGVINVRQVGGLLGSGGRRVRQNVLLRSGELSALGAEGCQQFSELGLRTVVDLRAASDAAATPNAECTQSSASYRCMDVPKILPPSPENYLATLDALEPKLPEVFEQLVGGQEGGLPALIHCVIGRDRASLTMALVLMALGVAPEDALRDFVENQDVAVEASWIDGVFARIDHAGGIDAYLDGQGVPASVRESLRAAALE